MALNSDTLLHQLGLAGDGRPVVLLPALAVATLVSEDLACIAAGVLVAQGTLGFFPAVLACFLGIFLGDLLLVLLGRSVGRTALGARPFSRWIRPEALARAERWIAREGSKLILTSRFLPGTRLPTYVAFGVLRAPLRKFAGWFALACAIWVPLLVGAARLLGETALRLFDEWSSAVPLLLGAALLAWLLARLGVGLATWRGRRLLLSRWRRLTRWEFWPMWAVYPPVVAYILLLGLRHGCLTLFTAVNPGIGAGGGLKGESKSEILTGLARAGDAIAPWILVSPGTVESRLDAVRTFAAARGWPVVLKPDVGERGSGVTIARDESAARAALEAEAGALIAQRYVSGVEFGVFYWRRPSAPHGEIVAITDKRMVDLVGDGRRTLEHLILDDDRAVCMARFFLDKFSAQLDETPAAGERVVLTELGTHCRGALFLDGTHLVTPPLLAAVERVSRAFDGFNFGRYDVRTPSAEALQRGEFSVIELNGLTSEATSMYDPRHNVFHGWRTLRRQWREAFAIAAEHRDRGARVLTLREFFGLVFARR